MGWAWLSVVVAAFGSVCPAFAIPMHQDLDLRKLAGTWHPILRAKYEPTDQPFYAYTLSPLNDGNLILKVQIPRMRACRLHFVALYALQPGIFENADGKVMVRLVDTDYDSYLISQVKKNNMAFMDLLARGKEVSEEVMKKFLEIAQELMLNPMLLFYQRKTDLCPHPT